MSSPSIPQSPPPAPARFRWRFGFTYLAGLCFAAAMLGYLASQVAHVRAPWLLFPLLVGVALGALAGGLAYLVHCGHRRTVLVATLMAGLVVVGTMHFVEYQAYLNAPRSAQFEMMVNAFPDIAQHHAGARPSGFLDFLNRMALAGRAMPLGWTAQGPWAWASWALDALFVVAGAMVVALVFLRRPYCDVCRNYYRVLRQEQLRPEQFERLARSLGWSVDTPRSASYQHLSCHGGCGPDLVRVMVRPASEPAVRRLAWIDCADRARVFQQLDQSA